MSLKKVIPGRNGSNDQYASLFQLNYIAHSSPEDYLCIILSVFLSVLN